TLPTDGSKVTGNYVWKATYDPSTPPPPDGNNNGASDNGSEAAEQLTVNKASPTIVTTASGDITLDDKGAPTLSDTIVKSGAYFPTGQVLRTPAPPTPTRTPQ